jgi:hypothetical protein
MAIPAGESAGRARRHPAITALRMELAAFAAVVVAAAALTRSVPETAVIAGGLAIVVLAVGTAAGTMMVAVRGIRAIRDERGLRNHPRD